MRIEGLSIRSILIIPRFLNLCISELEIFKRRSFMIRILIADDHTVVREGLKQIISETTDMSIADEAVDGHEVLNKALRNDYDVVVLDITMPGINGLDVLKQIKAQKSKLPILVLSMHPEEQYAVRVLKAGASGYLTKETASEELVNAIRTAFKGRKYITPSLGEKLAYSLRTDAEKLPHELLSDREYQVMCMIASGKTVKEISERLFLSVKTVSTYRARILEKMNMKNNVELTYYSLKNRLVE
jgi:two-component system invasion response regulator UvrY